MTTLYSLTITKDGLFACIPMMPIRAVTTSVEAGVDPNDQPARMSVGMLDADNTKAALDARFYLYTGEGVTDSWLFPEEEVAARGPSRQGEMIMGVRFTTPGGYRYDVEVARHPFSYLRTKEEGLVSIKMEWGEDLGTLEIIDKWGGPDRVWLATHRRPGLTPDARPS